MRAKLISAGVVLVLSVALCVVSLHVVKEGTELLRSLAQQSVAAMERDDKEGAMRHLDAFQMELDMRRPLLEVLTLHEAINQLGGYSAQARVRLMYGQKEEFASQMALMMEALTILYEQQRPSFSNLL